MTSDREWMRELARVRAHAAKLRASPGPAGSSTLPLIEDALRLLDQLRANCAELEARCAALERHAAARDRGARQLVDALSEGVVTTDSTGIILDANRAACLMLARSRGRLTSDLLLHFVEDREAFSRTVRELPQATGLMALRARFRPADRAPFDAAVTVLRDPRTEAPQWLWLVSKDSA